MEDDDDDDDDDEDETEERICENEIEADQSIRCHLFER